MEKTIPPKRYVNKKLLKKYFSDKSFQALVKLEQLHIKYDNKILFKLDKTNTPSMQDRSLSIDNIDFTIALDASLEDSKIDYILHVLSHHLVETRDKSALGNETLEKYKEINSIFQLSQTLSTAKYLDDVCANALKEVQSILPFSYCSLWIQSNKKNKSLSKKVELGNIEGFVVNDHWEERLIDQLLDQKQKANIYNGIKFTDGDETKVFNIMFCPLLMDDAIFGAIVYFRNEDSSFYSGDLKLSTSLGIQISHSLQNTKLFEEIEELFDSVTRSLIAAIDERDSTTSGHSARISMLSERFAIAINQTDSGKYKDVEFSPQELREIRYAGLLHDIGKIGVKEAILKKINKLNDDRMEAIVNRFHYIQVKDQVDLSLELDTIVRSNTSYQLAEEDLFALGDIYKQTFINPQNETQTLLDEYEYTCLSVKSGNLTWDEVKQMRKHAEGTAKILQKIKLPKDLKNLAFIASQHHEKLDGTGYPLGLKEQDILLASQIMCIADIYEALVAKDRPYKPPLPVDQALSIIKLEVDEGKIDLELYEVFKEKLYDIDRRLRK
ncbi:MAG: HD domain-containing protein [Candidatus Cloacimonetes bacterium]|nr:HD domain-containing protein [Candidatus Cloacimonadota bacterium]